MSDMSLLLISPLFACLTWIVIISVGTHLRLIKFVDEDDNISLNIGCYIVSFAFYFYVFLLNEHIYLSLRRSYFDILVYWNLGAAAMLLLLVRFFPGISCGGGGFISFNLRDAVFYPAITFYYLLLKAGVIRKGATERISGNED